MAFRHLVVLTALLASGTVAHAQDGGIRSELERSANTSDEEKLAYADTAKTEIAETLRQLDKMLEGARREGDADKVECITSRMTSVRALQIVSDNASVTMEGAIERGESDRADHEFRKLAVALGKTRMLSAEAQQCSSGAAVQPGQTIIETLSELLDDEEDVLDVLAQLELDELGFGMDPPDVSPFL